MMMISKYQVELFSAETRTYFLPEMLTHCRNHFDTITADLSDEPLDAWLLNVAEDAHIIGLIQKRELLMALNISIMSYPERVGNWNHSLEKSSPAEAAERLGLASDDYLGASPELRWALLRNAWYKLNTLAEEQPSAPK